MKKIIFTILLVFSSLLIFSAAQADFLNSAKQTEYNDNLNNMALEKAHYNNTSLLDIVGQIIRLALSVLGAIFLVLMFMAGNDWMQANGNEEKVKKSKKTIMNLLIGLVLVLVAYALSFGMLSLLSGNLLTK